MNRPIPIFTFKAIISRFQYLHLKRYQSDNIVHSYSKHLTCVCVCSPDEEEHEPGAGH